MTSPASVQTLKRDNHLDPDLFTDIDDDNRAPETAEITSKDYFTDLDDNRFGLLPPIEDEHIKDLFSDPHFQENVQQDYETQSLHYCETTPGTVTYKDREDRSTQAQASESPYTCPPFSPLPQRPLQRYIDALQLDQSQTYFFNTDLHDIHDRVQRYPSPQTLEPYKASDDEKAMSLNTFTPRHLAGSLAYRARESQSSDFTGSSAAYGTFNPLSPSEIDKNTRNTSRYPAFPLETSSCSDNNLPSRISPDESESTTLMSNETCQQILGELSMIMRMQSLMKDSIVVNRIAEYQRKLEKMERAKSNNIIATIIRN